MPATWSGLSARREQRPAERRFGGAERDRLQVSAGRRSKAQPHMPVAGAIGESHAVRR